MFLEERRNKMPKYLCVAYNMDGYVEKLNIVEAVAETEASEEMACRGDWNSIAINVDDIKKILKKEKLL